MAVSRPPRHRLDLGLKLPKPKTVSEVFAKRLKTLPAISKRLQLLPLLFAAPLAICAVAYGRLTLKLPDTKKIAAAPVRGRILLSDGTILANSTILNGVEQRAYPQGNLAGQLLGFKGRDAGLEGLERFEEDRLKSGQDVVLTIDPIFQASAEAGLKAAILENEAQSGSVVAIEASTGRIVAAASYPRLNPNKWRDFSPEEWQNRPFRNLFEPGSTIKALVAAALIDQGLAEPNTPIHAPMSRTFSYDPKTINDSVSHPSNLNLTSVLRWSSNVGISLLAERMPAKKLYEYLTAYGFGQREEIAGVSTARGILRSWQKWYPFDRATASFGQGFSTTTLQLATAFSVLANDGLYISPRLIEDAKTSPAKRVISAEAAQKTRMMLAQVVEEGLDKAVKIPGYCVAGKTGTAQVAIDGRYSEDVFGSLFACFLPCDKPKVVMVVEVYGGQKQHHGSQVSAPAFRSIAYEMIAKAGWKPNE